MPAEICATPGCRKFAALFETRCCALCEDSNARVHSRMCTSGRIPRPLFCSTPYFPQDQNGLNPATPAVLEPCIRRGNVDHFQVQAHREHDACMSVAANLAWYFDTFNLDVNWATLNAWEHVFGIMVACAHTRHFILHVFGTEHIPPPTLLAQPVHACDASHPTLYDLDAYEVTGCDYAVQAVVASRIGAPTVCRRFCLMVEGAPNTAEFGLYDSGGVHRSLAMACLLKRLVYPRAQLAIHSLRGYNGAKARGLDCLCLYPPEVSAATF